MEYFWNDDFGYRLTLKYNNTYDAVMRVIDGLEQVQREITTTRYSFEQAISINQPKYPTLYF